MSVNDHRTAPTTELFKAAVTTSDPTNATFTFGNEDHTLGNALRHLLVQRPETDFCGYSVPHPYEPSMNLRLQVKPPKDDSPSDSSPCTAMQVLKLGLKDLEEMANVLDDKFLDALKTFKEQQMTE